MEKKGRIVRIISNLYSVEVDGEIIKSRARGKFRNDKTTPVVGDFVVIDCESKYILKILPRKNELNRPHLANIDVGLIVTSLKKPDLSLNLLDKELCTLSYASINPVIILSKLDLLDSDEAKKCDEIFTYYKKFYPVFFNTEVNEIKKYLSGKVALLTGQTGAGKSTLINHMDEGLNIETNPISDSLGRGVHTTRHVELYPIADFYLADTPGFSALDLECTKDELKSLFPEFQNKVCKFKDCNHVKEIECGIKEALERGEIMPSRYENYIKFRGDVK